ncbi:MAG: SAM-dependent methyltransferase [Acidimicrobiales bacterium]
MTLRDYHDWHDDYSRPGSSLHRRLQVVVELLGRALDALPAGPVRVVSLCAGQGADILTVAEQHPRGRDLEGRLVELDPRNVAAARDRVSAAGLVGFEVVEADASDSDAYAGAVPADLVVACGIFGNISLDDIERTIRFLPSLSAPGTHVVWTRHPREEGVIECIGTWLDESGFERDALVIAEDATYGVGSAHLIGASRPLPSGEQLFTFIR